MPCSPCPTHGWLPAGPWWRRDPRLGQLGYRALVPTAAAEVSEQAATAVGEAEYRRLRYSMGVAEGDLEMPSGGVRRGAADRAQRNALYPQSGLREQPESGTCSRVPD